MVNEYERLKTQRQTRAAEFFFNILLLNNGNISLPDCIVDRKYKLHMEKPTASSVEAGNMLNNLLNLHVSFNFNKNVHSSDEFEWIIIAKIWKIATMRERITSYESHSQNSNSWNDQ